MEEKAISSVIIIPSYNEITALPHFLEDLCKKLEGNHAVLVVDDSDEIVSTNLRELCDIILRESELTLYFLSNGVKSGRGAAVRRGMEFALSKFTHLVSIVECDADGSHRAEDINDILKNRNPNGIVIGSRYLEKSEILGWPLGRLVFSKVLNIVIPKIIGIRISDVTNGFRNYSVDSVRYLCALPQLNSGFIYLSESAIRLKEGGYSFVEIPTTFVNRTQGNSTVSPQEVIKSLHGILRLITQKL